MKLISLNVQYDQHNQRVLSFLKAARADVVCLQEVFLYDLELLQEELGMYGYFAPMTEYYRQDVPDAPHEPEGLAILSKMPLTDVRFDYYATGGREAGDIVPFDADSQDSMQKVLLSGLAHTQAGQLRIGTTHFTWTPRGEANTLQRRDLASLIRILESFEHIVFCGDFNAPRGKEIFDRLADAYRDWLPRHITTTIDQELHMTKGLSHVVDTIFSTEHYGLDEVHTVSGVSDHCAVVGTLQALHRQPHARVSANSRVSVRAEVSDELQQAFS